MKKILLISLLISAMALSACSSKEKAPAPDSGSGEKSFTASLGSVAAETSVQIEAAKMFADKVKEYTNDTVKINVFPAGQIGSDESMAEDLERGNLEFAFLNQGSCAGLDQMLDFHYLPFIARNYEEADKLFYNGEVVPKVLKETLKAHKITVLGWYENEFRGISNSIKEIHTAEDLKGMKLRVPGSAAIKGYFEEAGAQTVTIAFSELYTALQQGTVDGQDNGILLTHDNKLEEKNKYYTNLKHVYAMSSIVVSDSMRDQLSQGQKDGILKAAAEAQDWEIKATRDQTSTYIDEMKSNGVVFTELSDAEIATFTEVADRLWEKLKGTYGEENINALKAEVAKVRGN